MRYFKNIRQKQNGSILLVFIITIPFLIIVAIYYMQLSLTSARVSKLDQLHTEAQLAADAGADYSVEQISLDNSWAGTGGEIGLLNDGKVRTTYTASVTGNDTAKVVSITGKAYWPVSDTTPKRTVKIYVDMRPVTSGNYSVVTGAGGLYMSNNSKVVSGSVYINGELTMSNSATIGLAISPVSVKIAHQICPNPADATFPRVCNDGENGQPITINGPSAHIYGDVTATNQTSGSGMTNNGLQPGTVPPQPLPTYDRDAQKAAVANNITGADASCSGSSSKTWQANTKITGDVSLSNSCTVTVRGDIWITGKLTLNNTSKLIIDNSVGATRPNIMVDGLDGITLNQSGQVAVNNVGTGAQFLTFYSTANCSPDCTSVTGTSLANSRSITTIALNNTAAAPNSIFYSYWTRVQLANSGQIGAVAGQTIQMSNSASITFGASVAEGETIWVVSGYRKQ